LEFRNVDFYGGRKTGENPSWQGREPTNNSREVPEPRIEQEGNRGELKRENWRKTLGCMHAIRESRTRLKNTLLVLEHFLLKKKTRLRSMIC
jgi:hypothetical protein